MGGFSLIHWLILGVVVLLLFGGNRFSAMMGDVAKGLKSFKAGMTDDDKPATPPPAQLLSGQQQAQQQTYVPPVDAAAPIELTPQPPHPDPAAIPRNDQAR